MQAFGPYSGRELLEIVSGCSWQMYGEWVPVHLRCTATCSRVKDLEGGIASFYGSFSPAYIYLRRPSASGNTFEDQRSRGGRQLPSMEILPPLTFI